MIHASAHVGVPYDGEQFCRTFAARVLSSMGVPVPVVIHPGRAKDFVRVDSPREGDIVVFTRSGRPHHVGVCLGRGRFIHVEEGSTSRIERLSSPMWSSCIEGYYRWNPPCHS